MIDERLIAEAQQVLDTFSGGENASLIARLSDALKKAAARLRQTDPATRIPEPREGSGMMRDER